MESGWNEPDVQVQQYLPANSTITWTLDPSFFKSRSGASLFPFNTSGSFTTGSGTTTTNDCNGDPTQAGIGTLSVFKSVHYVQTSASAPVLDNDLGASFTAVLIPPITNPVNQVSLQFNSTTKVLTNIFGRFFLNEQFPSQEALDAAYPPGNYVVTIKRA